MAARQISDGNPDGNTLGRDASDLVGFHGEAVAQASFVTAVTTATIISVAGSACFGFQTSDQAVQLITTLNSIRTALINKGILPSA